MTELFIAARLDAMPYLPILYTQDQVLWWVTNVLLKQTCVTIAADPNAAVAGFASVHDGWLEHLYVAPSAQGRGIGSRLLDSVKRGSPGGLGLHVFQRNTRARSFYERRGLTLIELRDGSQNEEREPDAVYAWVGDTA